MDDDSVALRSYRIPKKGGTIHVIPRPEHRVSQSSSGVSGAAETAGASESDGGGDVAEGGRPVTTVVADTESAAPATVTTVALAPLAHD